MRIRLHNFLDVANVGFLAPSFSASGLIAAVSAVINSELLSIEWAMGGLTILPVVDWVVDAM